MGLSPRGCIRYVTLCRYPCVPDEETWILFWSCNLVYELWKIFVFSSAAQNEIPTAFVVDEGWGVLTSTRDPKAAAQLGPLTSPVHQLSVFAPQTKWSCKHHAAPCSQTISPQSQQDWRELHPNLLLHLRELGRYIHNPPLDMTLVPSAVDSMSVVRSRILSARARTVDNELPGHSTKELSLCKAKPPFERRCLGDRDLARHKELRNGLGNFLLPLLCVFNLYDSISGSAQIDHNSQGRNCRGHTVWFLTISVELPAKELEQALHGRLCVGCQLHRWYADVVIEVAATHNVEFVSQPLQSSGAPQKGHHAPSCSEWEGVLLEANRLLVVRVVGCYDVPTARSCLRRAAVGRLTWGLKPPHVALSFETQPSSPLWGHLPWPL